MLWMLIVGLVVGRGRGITIAWGRGMMNRGVVDWSVCWGMMSISWGGMGICWFYWRVCRWVAIGKLSCRGQRDQGKKSKELKRKL